MSFDTGATVYEPKSKRLGRVVGHEAAGSVNTRQTRVKGSIGDSKYMLWIKFGREPGPFEPWWEAALTAPPVGKEDLVG